MSTANDVMPFSAPAYPKSWDCVRAEGLHVSFDTDESAAADLLAATPFELIAPRAWTYAGRLVGHGLAPAQDAWHYFGVYLPVRFREFVGRYPAYMYADNVEAIVGGRELLGEPKKWADFQWEEKDGQLKMDAHRYGRKLVSIEAKVEPGPSSGSPWEDLLVGTDAAGVAASGDLTFRSIPSPVPDGTAVQDVIVNPPEAETDSVGASVQRLEMYSGTADEPWLTLDPLGDLPINNVIGTYWQGTTFANGVKSRTPASIFRIAG